MAAEQAKTSERVEHAVPGAPTATEIEIEIKRRQSIGRQLYEVLTSHAAETDEPPGG